MIEFSTEEDLVFDVFSVFGPFRIFLIFSSSFSSFSNMDLGSGISLKSGGIFISDDIQDNLYFSNFVKNNSLRFAIVEFNGKFVGLIRKL